MATRRAPTQTWFAKNNKVYIGRYPDVSFGASTTLSGSFVSSGIEISAAQKSITVTPPETPFEKSDFCGIDTNNFQNQLLEEKPIGMPTITASLIVGEDETFEDYLMSGCSASAPTGYSRYQIGNNDTQNSRLTICAVMANSDGSKYVAYGLQDARLSKYGDVRVTGADSHLEQDVTFVGLAKGWYFEFKN